MKQTPLVALVSVSMVAASQLRGAMSPPQITPGFPVFAAALRERQAQTCEGSATLCPDNDGCCPIGEACGYTVTGGVQYGICEGTCKAGVAYCTAPIKACCQTIGDYCGADGTCSAGGGFPGPTSSSFYLPGTNTAYSTTTPYTSYYNPTALTYTTTSRSTGGAAGLTTTYDTATETFSGYGGEETSSSSTAPATVTVTPSGNAANVYRDNGNLLLGLPVLGFAWEWLIM